MARRTTLRSCVIVALALSVSARAAAQTAEQTPLSVGVTGATSPEKHNNPAAILGSPEVQRLFLELADSPKSRAEIDEVIRGQFFTLEDMVRVGLLREDGDLYRLDFNLLRVSDQERILEVAEQRGRDLAAAFLESREEFEMLALSHVQPGAAMDDLLFIVLGCFSLDWDGLALTQERGHRSGAQCVVDGYMFTPWAKETGASISLKGLYWGSHNVDGAAILTTFGDHDALPRFGLPDLMWNSGADFTAFAAFRDGRRAAISLADEYLDDALDDISAVMLALRMEALTPDDLAARAGVDIAKLEAILALLEQAEYVSENDGLYLARVVVLTTDDQDMIRAMLAKGREIMIAWHEQNYNEIRAALSDLTPLRHGVPFERVYTEIWHFIFGVANRELVAAGLFADPYAPERPHKGFIPFVWTKDLRPLVP